MVATKLGLLLMMLRRLSLIVVVVVGGEWDHVRVHRFLRVHLLALFVAQLLVDALFKLTIEIHIYY